MGFFCFFPFSIVLMIHRTVLFYFVHMCASVYGVSCSSEILNSVLECYRFQLAFTEHDLAILHLVAQKTEKYRRETLNLVVCVVLVSKA